MILSSMSDDYLQIDTDIEPTSEAPAPEWVELIPAGDTITGRDGRTWRNNDPQGIINAYIANGADVPIDIEHSTEVKAKVGEPAPAVGWVKELQIRGQGAIWGRVEWTEQGSYLVSSKAYRYLSPVWIYNRSTLSITKLDSVGLTNKPNLQLTALNKEDNNMILPLAVCTALGLPAAATEDMAVAKINSLQDDTARALNRADNPPLDKYVPRPDYDVAINRAKSAEDKLRQYAEDELTQRIDKAITDAKTAGIITPATEDYHRAACRQDGGLERFAKYVSVAPKVVQDSALDGKSVNTSQGLTPDELDVCKMLGVDPANYLATKTTTNTTTKRAN